MKRIVYIILTILLLVPFSAKAADYAYPVYNGEDIYVSMNCGGTELIGTTPRTCNLSLQKKDANKELKVNLSTNDTLKFAYDGTENSALEITAENNTDMQTYTFDVKSEAVPLEDKTVTINMNITYDGEAIVCDDLGEQTFTLKKAGTKPTEETKPDTPKKEEEVKPAPNTNNIKTSNKEVINPDTADINTLLYTLIGFVSIFMIGVTYKLIKQK